MKHIETGRRFRNQNWFSEQQMHIKLDFFLENISNIARMDFVGIKKLQLKHDEAKEIKTPCCFGSRRAPKLKESQRINFSFIFLFTGL